MAYQVFDECPEAGYTYSDILPVSVRRDAGVFDEARNQLAPIARRRYGWNLRRDNCVGFLRTDVDDFLIKARKLQFEAFFLKDPNDYSIEGVTLTLVSGTTYSLPTLITDEDYRHFPIDDANVVVYDAGVPVTVSSVDTDGRTFTTAAPIVGAPTADFWAYRLCRVDTEFQWASQSGTLFDTSVNIVEILRD